MPHNIQNEAGSELVNEPAFLVLGKLRRAHGVQGEIALEVLTSMLDLLGENCVVFIGDGYQPHTIEKTRWKQSLLLIKFVDIEDRDSVSELTNQLVYISADQLPDLAVDEVYYHQLLGLEVVFLDGEPIGILEQILETGANDVFVVKDPTGKEILIPFVESFIHDVDLDQGKIFVLPFEWYGGDR